MCSVLGADPIVILNSKMDKSEQKYQVEKVPQGFNKIAISCRNSVIVDRSLFDSSLVILLYNMANFL